MEVPWSPPPLPITHSPLGPEPPQELREKLETLSRKEESARLEAKTGVGCAPRLLFCPPSRG